MALRLGTENKKKTYIAIGLVILLILVAGYEFYNIFSGPTPEPVAAQPTPAVAPHNPGTPEAPAQGAEHAAARIPSAAALDPTLHPEVMEQAENTLYTGSGRNIFSPNSAPPPVEKPQPFRPSQNQASGPAAPPPPPPIDLKFYGYSTAPGAPKQIFLLHGDDIFLAHEGDVVDRRYRIVSIQPFSVQVEDIPYHDTQSIPLTQN